MPNISNYEHDLDDAIAALRSMANVISTDRTLTDEGKRENYSARVRLDGSAERGLNAAERMRATLHKTKGAAAAERAKLTDQPADPMAALAAEMRFNRRAKRIEAALNADGLGPVQSLLAQASDQDLPVLIEHVTDHFTAHGGERARIGEQVVEQSLRARSPQYAQAAQLAQQAGAAEQVVNEKVAHLQRLAEDHTTQPPSEHSLAVKSVNVVSETLGDLDADTAA